MEKIEPTDSSYRSYLYFWIGQLVSLLGSSIVQFVIIWWITVTTKDPLYLGIAAFLGFGSTIAVSLFAGVLVDRWDRKKVIFAVDGLQALATAVLIYLFWIGTAEIAHILVLLTVRGIFQGFHEPATMAILPIMVPKEKLRQVNSWAYLFNGIIFLIGPVLAAIILEVFGLNNMHLILMIDGLTFLVALIPLIMIVIPKIKSTVIGGKPSFVKEFKAGLSIIKDRKGLIPLMLTFTAANFFLTPLFVLLPFITTESALQGDVFTYSVAMALMSGGGILISLLLSKKKLFDNNALGVSVGLGIGYLAIIFTGFSVLNGFLIAFFMMMFINGVTTPIANIHSQQIWQTVVPPEFQGRVFAVRRTLAQVSGPLAMGLSGIVANRVGSIPLIIGAGIIGLVLNFYIWYFTSLPKTEELLKKHTLYDDEHEIPENIVIS